MVYSLQIGADICTVLTADEVVTGEVNYTFDSANFHTPLTNQPGRVLHDKQPWLAKMAELIIKQSLKATCPEEPRLV